ncbi:Probable Rho GTPase-activating protein CG5521 [Eumeta japonica]|uniref:Probable Rho GTPase-activating protein CG5521 n=1 Tax=Eumeta variegata TaxID=151549 RepID=A0A4C1TGE3_EUMVA|nr:Probable Rho GTPase-activating protein CG5521 [Eumeta japonica]
MDPKTWEQLLLVLLQVTSVVLHQHPPQASRVQAWRYIGPGYIPNPYCYLIRAHTNVPVNVQLWENFYLPLDRLAESKGNGEEPGSGNKLHRYLMARYRKSESIKNKTNMSVQLQTVVLTKIPKQQLADNMFLWARTKIVSWSTVSGNAHIES